MQRWSVALAILISALAVGAAAGCWWKAEELRQEARWLMERGSAHASEYAQTFDGAAADRQLEVFAQRRQVLERAHLWQRGQVLGVLVAALAAVGAWVLGLMRRLQVQMLEAGQELEEAAEEVVAASTEQQGR